MSKARRVLQPLADPKRCRFVRAALDKKAVAQELAAVRDVETRERTLCHLRAINQLLETK